MLQGIFQSPVPKSSQPDFRIYSRFKKVKYLKQTLQVISLIFKLHYLLIIVSH